MRMKRILFLLLATVLCMSMMTAVVFAQTPELVSARTGDDLKTPVIAVVACVLSVACIIFLAKGRRPRG